MFGKTVEEELMRLRQVFGRMRGAGLKLKPSKCVLFQKSVTYLGHIVSSEGVATDPAKTKAVADWPTPKNVHEVRSFLGLASYYRRFIRGFANKASPLHALTSKSMEFMWNDACQDAFSKLKEELQQAPVLAYPSPGSAYILDTDASGDGIGAVLSQVHEGKEKVVTFANRKLSKAENYYVTRRELLAVVVYLKYFRQYLYGQRVTVRTDHSSLRWLMNSKDPEGQLAHRLEIASEYDFTIQHSPGVKHTNSDSMSRRPCRQCTHCGTSESICESKEGECPRIDNMNNKMVARVAVLEPLLGNKDLQDAQVADGTMSWLMNAKRQGKERPLRKDNVHMAPACKTYWSYWDQLEIRDGVLHQRWETVDGRSIRWRLVVPERYRCEFISELHGGKLGGHLGLKKTLSCVRQRYYWSGMAADVRACLRQCNQCAKRKIPSEEAGCIITAVQYKRYNG